MDDVSVFWLSFDKFIYHVTLMLIRCKEESPMFNCESVTSWFDQELF